MRSWRLVAALQPSPVCTQIGQSLSAGKQRKLTAWLGAGTAETSSKPTAPAQSVFDSQPVPVLSFQGGLGQSATDTASQATTRANFLTTLGTGSAAASGRYLPSSFTRKGSGVKAGPGKPGGKAGQTSLRAFMQRPAAAATAIANAATTPNAVAPSMHPVPRASHGSSTAASAGLLDAAAEGSSDSQGHKTAPRQTSVGTVRHSSGAQDVAQLPEQDCPQLSSLSTMSQSHSLDAPLCTLQQPASDRGQKRTGALANDVNIEQYADEQHIPESATVSKSHQQAAVGAVVSAVSSSQSSVSAPESQPSLSAASDADKAAVSAAWSKIQSKMKAPKCRGHNEDCVIREVKKNGPNKGETACGKH